MNQIPTDENERITRCSSCLSRCESSVRESPGAAPLLRRSVAQNEIPNGHRLSFDSADETLPLVFKAFAAERRYCEFLRFQITVEPGGGPIALELTGPPGTREFLTALLES
jgi:hypothetical protein